MERKKATPDVPLHDPRFDYTSAAKTDVQKTWRKYGWTPPSEQQNRSK